MQTIGHFRCNLSCGTQVVCSGGTECTECSASSALEPPPSPQFWGMSVSASFKHFTPSLPLQKYRRLQNQCHMQHRGKCVLGKSRMMVLRFGYLPKAYSNDVIWKMYLVALIDVYIKCLASAMKEVDVCTEIGHIKRSQFSCMYKKICFM